MVVSGCFDSGRDFRVATDILESHFGVEYNEIEYVEYEKELSKAINNQRGSRRVRIKTWEIMEREFGLTFSGDIKCLEVFTFKMERLLPVDRVIGVFMNSDDKMLFRWMSGEIDYAYHIFKDMIEEIL